MGRTPRVFLGLMLLLYGLRTGFCVTTVRTEPASGSFIYDFEGARNISLFCEVEDGGIRRVTELSLLTAEDVRMGANPGPIDHTRFVLSGETVISQGFVVSLDTNLTVLELTAELDQAIIFCGTNSLRLANFTLRTYKPPVLNNAGAIFKMENETFFLDLSEGNPPASPFPPFFMWSRDRGGELVNETGQREYNYSSVFIKSVQPSDSCNYALTATHYLPDGTTVVSTDTGSFFLNVLFGARLSCGDESVAVAQGETVTLVCGRDLRGNPTPQIEWTDSRGSPITDGGRFRVSSSEEIVSLTVANTVQEDSGNWTCKAEVHQNDNTLVGDAVEYSIRLVVVAPECTEERIGALGIGDGFAIGLSAILLIIGTALICYLVSFYLRKHLHKGEDKQDEHMYHTVDLKDVQRVHTEGHTDTTQSALPVEPNVAYHSVQPPHSVGDTCYENVF